MDIKFLIYLALAGLIAFAISVKTDRKFLSFVLTFWIFTQPVINALFVVKIPGLNVDLSPNRVLFLFALAYLILGAVSGTTYANGSLSGNRRPPFEKYMYIYLAVVIIAILVNYSSLGSKTIIAVPIEIVTFITVYALAKKHMTESVLEAIFKAIVLLSVFSVFVTIVQATVGPMFLRTGEAKEAFGTTLRAFGIFQFDGELGMFQVLSLMLVLVRYKGMARLNLLVPLLVISVFLSFTRLGYLILFVSLLTYVIFFSKKKLGPILVMLVIPALFVLAYVAFKPEGGGIENRLKSDTVSGRIEQYQVVMSALPSFPLGMGGYENPTFVELMKKHGMVKWVPDSPNHSHPEALEVHNGYLDVGIRYGMLGMITFVALLVSMIRYFKKRVSSSHRYSMVPFFAGLVWALANTTQTETNFRSYFVVLLAMLCGSFISMNRLRVDKQPRSRLNKGSQ